MWSYVTTMYLINPLPGYVESIAGDPESLNAKEWPLDSYLSMTLPAFKEGDVSATNPKIWSARKILPVCRYF